MKRHQVWHVKMSPEGEFVSAVFECLLCDLVVVTSSPAHAMMQVCNACADKQPTREDIDRIFASGLRERRDIIDILRTE